MMLVAAIMLLAVGCLPAAQAGSCDKCMVPVAMGGCKCNSNCDCTTVTNKCDKCNVPVESGGCKCNSNCDCITTGANKCDKCNIPVTSGGCKCDSNCDCIGTQPPSGNVLYSGDNIIGTYYYDLRTTCPQDTAGYAENNGYPRCTSDTPGPFQQTIAQVGSNNIIAIDNNVLSGNRARLCGKKVLVYKNGVQVRAPDGGDFFVWDGCAACIGGGKIDFSVSGARAVDPAACTLGLIPGVSFRVVDEVVKQFVP